MGLTKKKFLRWQYGDVVNAVFKSGAIEVVFQTIAIDTGSIGKVIRLKRDDG